MPKAKTQSSATALVKVHARVQLARGVAANVRFFHNKAKDLYLARSRGLPPIRVRESDDHKGFTASVGGEIVTAKSADLAFSKAVKHAWA